MDSDVLMDKVKGAWAGKTIGCTYGLPTEFGYCSRLVPDELVIKWDGHEIYEDWVRNTGNDDVYMNFTFVKVIDKYGIDAPADSFAVAFAGEKYHLWHANQQGRYNVLHGLMPPACGHWMNNPHADDIDFQIEADFAGIMNPGSVDAASRLCDVTGHVMNYGDGWYGGVYVAAMYSLAFVSDDMDYVVNEALKAIPEGARYRRCMEDVIRWHAENPSDWKAVWQLLQDNWCECFACPDLVKSPMNIDAVINSAYVLMGLLYGEKDFFKTMDIAMRCGQDSDCNPATAAGILGTMLGYSNIPEKWTSQVEEIASLDYARTGYSLEDVYRICYNQALASIASNGGRVDGSSVRIKPGRVHAVRFEQCFEGQTFDCRVPVGRPLQESETVSFNGTGIILCGGMNWVWETEGDSYVAQIEVSIDGQEPQTVDMPVAHHDRRDDIFFRFGLEPGDHELEVRLLNPDPAWPVWFNSYCVFK